MGEVEIYDPFDLENLKFKFIFFGDAFQKG